MTTRLKLLLSALACILCIVIVLSTDLSHQPFQRLSAADITSFDLETEVGLTVSISKREDIAVLAGILNNLTLLQTVDPEGTVRADYTIFTDSGSSYRLIVYDGFITLDGVSCAADLESTSALYEFAKRFA